MPHHRPLGVRPAMAGILALSIALGGCAATTSTVGSAGAPHPRVWKPAKPDTLGPVVAVVGNRRITRHDVDSLVATVPENQRDSYRGPAGYRKVIDYLVEREIAYQGALRDHIDRDSSYRAELETSSRDLLIRHFYRAQFARMPSISDSSIKGYYDSHARQFENPARAQIRHIQLPTEAKARAVLRKLTAGATWDAMCSANSTDGGTKGNGGILGFVAETSDDVPGIGKSPEIVKAAFALGEGRTSAPIRSSRGWHLIRVDTKEPASKRTLDSARSSILAQLRSEQRESYGLALQDSLKRYSGATVFEDSIPLALHPAQSAQQLFEQAQSAVDANTRIQLYQSLIKQYPKDKAAVQALFMIGFTYAEDIGDYDEARDALQEFLHKYPDSDLATSAKWMIENMDKPNPAFEDSAPADSSRPVPPHGTGSGSHSGTGSGGTPKGSPQAPWR